MKKNGFFTFVCACIPGCGQMYLGYMRRGISLAFWFWGIIALAALLSFGVLSLILPVIWAFAFFDTFNIRALTPQQQAGFPDDFIPNTRWLEKHNFGGVVKKYSTGKLLAWGLIIFGILLLYNTLVSRMYWWLWQYIPALAEILDVLLPAAVGFIVIFLGIRMLRRPGKATAAGPQPQAPYRQPYQQPYYQQPPAQQWNNSAPTGGQDAGFTPSPSQSGYSSDLFPTEAPQAPAPPSGGDIILENASENISLELNTDEPVPEPAPEPAQEPAQEPQADA